MRMLHSCSCWSSFAAQEEEGTQLLNQVLARAREVKAEFSPLEPAESKDMWTGILIQSRQLVNTGTLRTH